VPDGAASLAPANPPRISSPQYFELNRYGLLFTAKQFLLRPWNPANAADPVQQLHFGDLVHSLISLFHCAQQFYGAKGYRGDVTIGVSIQHVHGQVMRFRDPNFTDDDTPDEFRCYTNDVSVERVAAAQLDRNQQINLTNEILAELSWPFWQGNGDYPRAHLEQNLLRQFQRYYQLLR
jgi:hypothetical protein